MSRPKGTDYKMQAAIKLIRTKLGGGAAPIYDIYREARGAGIDDGTTQAAARRLQVTRELADPKPIGADGKPLFPRRSSGRRQTLWRLPR